VAWVAEAWAEEPAFVDVCDIEQVQEHHPSWEEDMAGYSKFDYAQVLSEWLELAESGDPKFQFYLGKMYQFGDGVEVDPEKSLFWYKKSSEQGYPVAQNNFALLYEAGDEVGKDISYALNLMCSAAQAGLSVSQFNMGRYYQFGIGVEVDGLSAKSWYEKAIEQNHPGSMYNLGIMYNQGVLIKQDVIKSVELIENAANRNLPPAIHDMGNIYFNGIGNVDVSLESAIHWYRKGVDAGVPESSYMLGVIYFNHNHKVFDANRALKYMSLSAEMGLIDAIRDLGNRYQFGDGVKKNLSESINWFKKGSVLGDSISSFLVSYAYSRGKGVEKDEKESHLWAIKAAEQGHVSSMAFVANNYLYGLSVDVNYKKALFWANQASDNGNIFGKYALGIIYLYGYGVDADILTSVQYLKEVAFNGNKLEKIEASKSLGRIYQQGKGVDIDLKESVKWFEVSAELGDAEAQNNLGLIYHNGQGVRKDVRVALYWYQMSANQGYGMAQNNLGTMYERGDGVDVDYEEAMYWFEKAADNDVLLAVRNLALFYINGRGVHKDVAKGIALLEKAEAKGDVQAAFSLATIYEMSTDIIQDHKKAFSLYHDIALMTKSEKFNPLTDIGKTILAAQAAVARMYLHGKGVDKNYKESFSWYMQAHNNGLPELYDDVENAIATAYIYGLGIDRDIEAARKFDRVAVNEYLEQIMPIEEQMNIARDYMFVVGDQVKAVSILEKIGYAGNVNAQKLLGAVYSNKGFYLQIEKDIPKAEYWYGKAIEQGDIEAEANLGAYYIYNSVNEYGVRDSKQELKGFLLSKSAKDKGYLPAFDVLAFAYQHGSGTEVDIEKAISILRDKLDISISDQEKDDTLLKILDIQVSHNLYDELTPTAFLVLRKRAISGNYKMQLKLGKYYMLDEFKYHDTTEGKKWLHKSSKKTIEANIILANYSFGFKDFEFDYKDVEKYIRNGISLFESQDAVDYELFANFSKDRMIDMYQDAVLIYIERGMYELAESMLRKSTSMHDGSVKQFSDRRDIFLASMSSDDKYAESKFLDVLSHYNNTYEIKTGLDGELLFAALDGLSTQYEKQGMLVKSALFLEQELDKLEDLILERDAQFFGTYFYLEIARKYIRAHDKERAEYFFDKYKKWINKKEIKVDRKLGQMMAMAVSSYIAIENDQITDATNQLLELLSWMDTAGVPVTPWSFVFGNEIADRMREKGHINEAFMVMSKIVQLYKKFLRAHIKDGSRLAEEQKIMVKQVVSDYLHLAESSNHEVEDYGFDVLQLTSGLSSSQSVVNAIQRSKMSRIAAVKSKEIEKLSRKKNKLLNEKYATLGGRKGNFASINTALDRIDAEVQLLRSEVRIELAKNSKEVWKDLLKPTAAVQSAMTDTDALLSMMVAKNRTHVWLITKQGVFRQSQPIGATVISEHVQQLLAGLDPKGESLNEFQLESSAFLYDLLIHPFSEQLSSIDRLIIAPDSALSTMPFSVLADLHSGGGQQSGAEVELLQINSVTRGIGQTHQFSGNSSNNYQGVNWLISRFAISVVPSVYSYVESEVKRSATPQDSSAVMSANFLGVGNPVLAGARNSVDSTHMIAHVDLRGSVAGTLQELAPLPETEAELITIGSNFEHSEIIVGEMATEKNLREMDLMKYEVISFATHALVSNEIEYYLDPSLVLTPVDDNSSSNDGLLTSKEVSALHMDADIVLLSACNTASSYGESSGEGLSGLADAFFQAGAKSLLVSYWSVISDAAMNITTRMFAKENQGKSYAHKHRNSVLSLIASKEGRVSHPSYWAPFSVIGVY